MKTPSKTPGSPTDFWELPRLTNMKTGNFLLVAKMQLGTFFTRNENAAGNFFRANRELPAPTQAQSLPRGAWGGILAFRLTA